MEYQICYTRAIECKEDTFGCTCYQCGKCGRKFKNGVMIDDGGTTPDTEE